MNGIQSDGFLGMSTTISSWLHSNPTARPARAFFCPDEPMTPADHAEKLAHVTQTTAYTSAAGGVIFGLTASEWGAIAAIISGIVAILSFIANQWWKWQHFKLAKEGVGERNL